MQRRLFHAFCQARRYTTSGPRLQAGREPCALALELMHLETLRQADWWVERYLQRCEFWADFLEDVSHVDGRRQLAHERLGRARSSLSRPVSRGTLFTHLDPALTAEGPPPRTNDAIERLNREIRRCTRVAGTFPDGRSALMFVTARLKYVAGSEWGSRRYLDVTLLEG